MKTKLRILSGCALVALWFGAALVAQTGTLSPLDEAQAALRARDYGKAAALLEPLTLAGAQDAAAFHLLSQVRFAQKDAKRAIALAEQATELEPSKPAHFSQLGMAYAQRMGEVGFMQQAMMAGKLKQAFASAVALDPNDVAGLIGLGRYYANAPEIAGGSLEKAKEYALRVSRLNPFLGAVELGQIAVSDENPAEALAQFETAAKLRPADAQVQMLCGRVLAQLGRKDEARVRFEAALALQPDFEAARVGRAELDTPK